MKKLILIAFLVFGPHRANAQSDSGWSIRPAFTFGYNKAQKSYYSLGLNVSTWANEYILYGVGAYYSAGSPSSSTREMGAGPFVAFFMPFGDNLTGEIREEILFMDQRQPWSTDNSKYETETGLASVTMIGLHFKIMEHFGISGGYRMVVGLTNEKLDDDRSGTYLGLALSI